ncbi:YcjF family protein [Leuconostoc mesenteroides]|uniref:YcjF family protein n=1 Tax=Leuconostoc mesenteroides TaxID=1245 RepID=UPI002360CDAC|nr:YcjF family protein [Leuconostoc mesenteroides]
MDKNQLNQENHDPVSEDKEFNSFFSEVLQRFPDKTSKIIQNSYEKSKSRADKIFFKSRSNLDQVFDTFLTGVDQQTAQKCHRIIHAASLSAAIVGCSPIPFSDAFLLVPIQLTMMSRLHKLFGQSWSEGLGKSLSKELVLVGLGRSAVGNIIKFIPAVGTVSGAVINASVAVSITEALGWVTVKMLNDGEDIFEQAMSFRGQFEILFKALRKAKK